MGLYVSPQPGKKALGHIMKHYKLTHCISILTQINYNGLMPSPFFSPCAFFFGLRGRHCARKNEAVRRYNVLLCIPQIETTSTNIIILLYVRISINVHYLFYFLIFLFNFRYYNRFSKRRLKMHKARRASISRAKSSRLSKAI